MAKTIIVAGYGPGISNAVAEKFGREGFRVALVGRTASRLDEGVKALAAKGIEATAFAADFGDSARVKRTIGEVREKLGPIHAIHWNVYNNTAGTDLLSASPDDVHAALDIATVSVLAAIQASLPDLKKEKGAFLATNGFFGDASSQVNAISVQYKAMGLSLANAAKHKLIGMLHEQLKDEGVYVGEIMVAGMVKGTAYDTGNATLDAADIAAKFHELYTSRKEWTFKFG